MKLPCLSKEYEGKEMKVKLSRCRFCDHYDYAPHFVAEAAKLAEDWIKYHAEKAEKEKKRMKKRIDKMEKEIADYYKEEAELKEELERMRKMSPGPDPPQRMLTTEERHAQEAESSKSSNTKHGSSKHKK